jgi:methylamine dehydrogenase accessory protein MauD
MTEALLVSNALLWLVVLVLAAVVAALVRQIGILHERVAPAGALVGREGPRVGEAAPRLTVDDWNGAPVALGGPSPDGRATLIAFVSPTCSVCKTMLEILDAVMRREQGRARVLFASDGPRAEHEAFVRAHGMAERGYLLSSELGLVYQVGKLPYAVLVDGAGVLRAKGLINTREHVESLFEAMDRGVATVQDYLARQRGNRDVA